MKNKKKISALIAAALCCIMLSGTAVHADSLSVSASAAESTAVNSEKSEKALWKESKELAGAYYNSKYIKWVKKYSAKEQKNTVTFGKSKFKKEFGKFLDEIKKEDPQAKINVVNDSIVISYAVKDGKIKCVTYEDGEAYAVYTDTEESTLISLGDKSKLTLPAEGADFTGSNVRFLNDDLKEQNVNESLFIEDSDIGKVFKFKSGGKIYTYEEFESEWGDKIGALFNSDGRVIAVLDGEEIACWRFYYNIKDSEFDIPAGYKEVENDELYNILKKEGSNAGF